MELSRRNLLKTGMVGAGALTIMPIETTRALAACGPTTWPIWAGQTNNVGTVTVWNDATYVYVKYTLTVAGDISELHLWLGSDLANVPAAQGNPVPGQFPWKITLDGTSDTEYTFAVKLADVKWATPVGDYCGKNIYVVAHCTLSWDSDGNGTPDQTDTGYGGDTPGPTGKKWWFYGLYNVCCDISVDPPPPTRLDTAFAKGNVVSTNPIVADHWILAEDGLANPQHLPHLDLLRNRWGWCIHLFANDDGAAKTYKIIAGAGLNRGGTWVGNLSLRWNKTTGVVIATYAMFNGTNGKPNAFLREVHVYAGDFKPVTAAPGQYGYTQYFDPAVRNHTAEVFAEDTNGDGIWVIAHCVANY